MNKPKVSVEKDNAAGSSITENPARRGRNTSYPVSGADWKKLVS
ncbi:hypothetical protein [Brevibacillus brevis]|nr:hypothetical protein [Brevibacillus brevis]WJQ81656.1 hypothetical protein QN310_00165 [Brevibacillus brevis]